MAWVGRPERLLWSVQRRQADVRSRKLSTAGRDNADIRPLRLPCRPSAGEIDAKSTHQSYAMANSLSGRGFPVVPPKVQINL